MIKAYFLLAIKHFRKQRVFSFINILGLTVGITCCLMIFLFIVNEFSYDRFHRHANDIYRVMRTGNNDGQYREIPYLSPPFGPTLVNDFPGDILHSVRVMRDNDLISYNDISFNEKNIYLADSNFFSFFDFELVRGDRHSVLQHPNSVVLTRSTAKKYFGDEDPIGKVLEFNKNQQLKVTGIARDVPSNSHLQFDMVVPLELLRPMQPEWFNQWRYNGLFTYVQLNPAVNPGRLVSKFPDFMDKYLGEYYKTAGFRMGLTLKPLKEIYFANDAIVGNAKQGNKKMVYIFMSVAMLILVIACINFINLATARATDRAKEVGLRKAIGAGKRQLVSQFMMESVLYAAIACLLSVGLVQALMPAYNSLLGYELPSPWSGPAMYIFLACVVVIVGVLAGSYPAFMLASFSPIESLAGKFRRGNSGSLFRKGLVVFQFAISVLLIIGVVIMMNQMNFLKNTDLGFHKEQTMIVRFDNLSISERRGEFKNELMRIPSVQSVSLMSGEPGGFHDGYAFDSEAKPGEKLLFNTEFTDHDFVKTLGLKLIAGRDLSESHATDAAQAALINRSAANVLGITPERAVGTWIRNMGRDSVRRIVVGVVEDYHFATLKNVIGPLVISPGSDRRLALVRINTKDLQSAIGDIKKVYSAVAPDYPFEYGFLDERFEQLYQAEERQQSVLGVFSALAIFIACLGLFGLASFTAIKRTKEIGVRKVLGSSVSNIIFLLSRDLLKPVLVGTLIAIPAGYYAMSKWLEGFAYRINFEWWMFGAAVLAALLIALLTVGFQALKAALANPVKSLRTE